jgi:hypothetical protein
LKIWHDNSGKGNKASWYLKYAIVTDIQTKKKYYFICEKWFAVNKGDYQFDRVLPVSTTKQKQEFEYLIKKETKNRFSDGHLWFSVVARPVLSSFSRLDRLTCCFVFLCINMLMNIMYYDSIEGSTNPNGLRVGPFFLTPEQVLLYYMFFKKNYIIIILFTDRSRSES